MASADRVPLRSEDPHVSGTATACRREMLSTIGSALCHGSTTASSFAILSVVVFSVVLVLLLLLLEYVRLSTVVLLKVLEVLAIVVVAVADALEVFIVSRRPAAGLMVSSLLLLLLLLLNTIVLSVVSVVFDALLSPSVLLVLVGVDSVSTGAISSATTIGAVIAVVVDHRPALAGVQLACTSPAFPQAPISYLRLVAVVA